MKSVGVLSWKQKSVLFLLCNMIYLYCIRSEFFSEMYYHVDDSFIRAIQVFDDNSDDDRPISAGCEGTHFLPTNDSSKYQFSAFIQLVSFALLN